MVIFKNAKTVRHEFSVYDFSYILRRLLRYFENFATASRLRCQQNSSTVELVDHICDGRRVVHGCLLHVGRP